MTAAANNFPSLDELGRDLLQVSGFRRAVSLTVPFALAALFFVFAMRGLWLLALACPVALSFLTYGSTSHDLVHRTLRLPPWLNEPLLCATELICLRSGHAYRTSHLYHHAHFPADDDLEAKAARLPLGWALLDGLTLQYRLFFFALKKRGPHRAWMIGEGLAALVLFTGAFASLPWTPLPALYCALMIAGSWVFPIATVLIPHDARGGQEWTQTRLFRGRVLSLLAFEHLYHLEHHLYPQVPHHNWPELAHRLDPHFERLGVRAIKLFF